MPIPQMIGLINSMAATISTETETDVFTYFNGSVRLFHIQIFPKHWMAFKKAEFSAEVYLWESDALQKLAAIREELEKYMPVEKPELKAVNQ